MKVLLAEDSRVTRHLLAATIEEAGHEVSTAANGREAWEIFERERPAMLIVDWLMPEMDGLEVCRRVRAAETVRSTFVLVITGRGATEDVEEALAAGADDFVAKPVTPELLRARLTISERRIEQNAAQRRAEEAAARAQWLAGIGHTALALQHEINNPLMAILAGAELLAHDDSASPELRGQIAMIANQSKRIAELVRTLAHLDDPRTIEYLGGKRMLDLSAASGRQSR